MLFVEWYGILSYMIDHSTEWSDGPIYHSALVASMLTHEISRGLAARSIILLQSCMHISNK
jgi:hypothetical protein